MLTKSDLQSLLQCRRKLWLEHRRPDLIPRDEPTLYRRATDGNIVGERARAALGSGVLVPQSSGDKATAAQSAYALLQANAGCPGAEIPLVREELYARADALIPQEQGYVLQETKSSTFPLKSDKVTPDKPKEHHLADIAIQAWVMRASGLQMRRAELNLLDNQWRYPGNDDYRGLFKQLDVTGAISDFEPKVPGWLDEAKAVLAGDLPDATTGHQCKEPYACPFIEFCQQLDPPGPEHPLTLLPDAAGKNLAKKLLAKGHDSLLDPKPEELTGTQAELYQRIQRAHRSGQPILEPAVSEIMRGLPYPRYYFDFEGIDLPVPRWQGVRPYEQIPFQWSCHVERTPGNFEHFAFLDLSGNDPSLSCIQKMLEVINQDDDGPILVYYQAYEKGRVEGLGQRHPNFADAMNRYIARLVDLHPIVKQHFYDPAMRGSFSIKKVLPVIAPDLRYTDLDGVQEGTGAQVAYLYACFDENTSDVQKEALRQSLLSYCEQDTWAMVEVGYFLEGKPRPTNLRPLAASP